MTPYAYKITDSTGNVQIEPTVKRAVELLKTTNCPVHLALALKPVKAIFDDGHTEIVDLVPYTETCEPTPEQVREVEKKIDAVIEDNERRWAEKQKRIAAGEKVYTYSGEFSIFRKDREAVVDKELRRYRIRWKP